MWLNKNTTPYTRIKKPKRSNSIILADGIKYSEAIISKWSEVELEAINIFKFIEDSIPNRRYYTYIEDVDEDAVVIGRTPIDRDVDAVKASMFSDINDIVKAKQYPLDVFYMRNLKGRKPVPQDVQNQANDIYATQDVKEAEIEALTTLAECIDYEHFAYDYTITQEDVDNDIDGTLVLDEVVQRYKNKVKDW